MDPVRDLLHFVDSICMQNSRNIQIALPLVAIANQKQLPFVFVVVVVSFVSFSFFFYCICTLLILFLLHILKTRKKSQSVSHIQLCFIAMIDIVHTFRNRRIEKRQRINKIHLYIISSSNSNSSTVLK